MKRIITAILVLLLLAASLTGCADNGDAIKVTLTLMNSTEYEIESFGLAYAGDAKRNSKNPMEYPEESDTSLKQGQERSFTFSIYEKELPKWGVNMNIAGMENLCYSSGTISLESVIGYEITFDGVFDGDNNPVFQFAPPSEAADESDSGNGYQDDLAYWNGLDFGPNLEYGEEYEIQGDPGEYLSAAEGAKLTFDTMKANGNIPEYSDDLQYTMTLVDLADINGEECYVYRLDVDEPSGTIGAAYAYAYQSGNIYMQGQGGQWVIPE